MFLMEFVLVILRILVFDLFKFLIDFMVLFFLINSDCFVLKYEFVKLICFLCFGVIVIVVRMVLMFLFFNNGICVWFVIWINLVVVFLLSICFVNVVVMLVLNFLIWLFLMFINLNNFVLVLIFYVIVLLVLLLVKIFCFVNDCCEL